MSFIVALFTDTSTELMSGAKLREWVHHNSTNQPTNQPECFKMVHVKTRSNKFNGMFFVQNYIIKLMNIYYFKEQ